MFVFRQVAIRQVVKVLQLCETDVSKVDEIFHIINDCVDHQLGLNNIFIIIY